MIKRIPCNKPTFFDVDDTLFYWSPTAEQIARNGLIEIKHKFSDGIERTFNAVPHKLHLDQLIKHANRGHTIVLWSAGGEEWANAAAIALGLDKIEGMVYTIEKPCWAYDDKKPNEFFETKFMEDK